MDQRTKLILVAFAAFGFGMVVDRLLFSPQDAREQDASNRRKSDLGRRSEVAGRGTEGSRSGREWGRHEGRGGRSDRGGESGREEDGLPAEFHRELERIERGGHIDAAIASNLVEQAPKVRKREVIAHLASHWARRDPESALAWAEGLEGVLRREAFEHILHHWAEGDPSGAAAYLTALPNSELSLHMVERVGHLWARRDREEAIAWAREQSDPAIRERALRGVVGSWGEGEPAAAAAFAMSIGDSSGRRAVLEMAARQWANHDAAAALDWAGGLPVGDRSLATNAILRGVAELDPVRAATMYGEMTVGSPEEGPRAHEQRRIAQELAAIWASSSPSDAAAWAMKLPERGEIRQAAVGAVAEHWLRLDGMAAGEWILQLPEGRTRDAAAERVVGTVVHTDPESAFAWANSMSNEDHRVGALHHVLERWSMVDREAARAALGDANVAVEHRAHLEEVFGGPVPPASEAPRGDRSP